MAARRGSFRQRVLVAVPCSSLDHSIRSAPVSQHYFRRRIALPSYIFYAMLFIDFSTLRWRLVLGLALGRLVVFIATVLCTLLVTSGNPMATAKAGIRGIFVTQQNDFALGLPVLASL